LIDDPQLLQRLNARFDFLAADQTLAFELGRAATAARLPEGTAVCTEGERCAHLALLVEGAVRVHKPAHSGRDITLYRIGPGDSCILTASCILTDAPFPAVARSESAIAAVMVPAGRVRSWLDRFPGWRRFVFSLVTRRLAEVISVLEEVAFERMDVRVARHLLVAGSDHIRTTHQEIADELGTSREVVTRVLGDLESLGLLQTRRGEIQLLDGDGLKRLGRPSVT
jgi:CRP/FNR family transcriptional regulator